MTDSDYAPIEARAERLGISTSEALRQLVQLGAWFDDAQAHGLVMTNQARQLLGDGGPAAVLRFVRPTSGLEMQVTRDQGDAINQGAAVIAVPEDFA